MKFYLFAVMLILCAGACTNNKRNDNASGIDNDRFTPPVIVHDTSNSPATFALTPLELQDDSIFSDGSIPTSWQNAGIADVNGLKVFIKQLQQMVMNNDKVNLAAAVQYPLKNIQSTEALIKQYDEVFTKEVKLSLAAINFSQLFRNQNGVMTEGGKLWIRQVGKGFKIVAIN